MTERELEQRRRGGLGPWLVASVVVHLAALGALFILPFDRWFASGSDEGREPPIEFTILDDKGLTGEGTARVQDLVPPEPEKKDPEKAAEEEKQPEEDDPKAKGQVVEVPPPAEEKRPDKAKYLSEYNSSVAKETRARARGKAEQPAAAPQPEQRATAPRPPSPPQPQAKAKPSTGKEAGEQGERGEGGTPAQKAEAQKPGDAEKKPSLLAMRTDVRRGERSRSELGLSPAGEREGRGDAARKERGERSAGGGAPKPSTTLGRPAAPGTPGSVLPSFATSSRAAGGGSLDYLKDVEEGATTALNSKQWRFASFFNRVKRQVAQNWHPDVVYRRYDPNGQVFGSKDRFTLVRVQLNKDGSLRQVSLEKPSGVEFLDDEAITALKQAQPFVNPPAGLVDKKSGLISFKFGFYFEIGSASKIKLFRY